MSTQIQLKSKELDGTDYVYVYADGNPIQNGDELKAAVTQAYADYSVTNRMQTVLLGPGTYDMNFDSLKLNETIRIEGLSDDRNATIIKSVTVPNQPGMVFDLPGFDFHNAFNESYKALLLQNFNFNSVFSSTDDYIYGTNNTQIARISTADGSYITAPNPTNFNSGSIYADKVSGDVFYYSYNYSLGTSALVKLNSSLGVDNSFAIATINNSPKQILKDINTGGYFICGNFTVINGFSRQRIAKFNADGSLDVTFNVGTGINSDAQSMVHLPMTNELIVGGFFDNYNGNTVQYVAVLDGTTATYSALAGQTSGFNGPIQTVYNDIPNSQLIFSGYFNVYNGLSVNRAVKTNYSGGGESQLFLSQIAYDTRMYSNYVIRDNYVYVLFSNSTYNGTSYVNGTVLKLNLSDGLVVDTYNLFPTSVNFADQRFFLFNDSSSTQYLIIPYYISSSAVTAIDVNTPIPYISVYINNVNIDGVLLNNTRLTVSNIYTGTYMDRGYYNGDLYPGWGFGLTARNSEIGNLKVSTGNISVEKSSTINGAEISPVLQASAYMSINIQDSTIQSFFNNAKRADMDLYVANSSVNSSFNSFLSTPRTSANNFEGSLLTNINVYKSKIEYSFNSTLTPSVNVKDSFVSNSFISDGNASSNEDQMYINWDVSGCNGENSFIFNTGKSNPSFPDTIAVVRISDCNISRSAFYIKTIVRSAPYQVSFSNVHVPFAEGNSLCLDIKTIDTVYPWESNNYNWYQGVLFENCSVTNVYQWNVSMNAISILIDESLTTPSTSATLSLQNFIFNNCKVTTNGGMLKSLDIIVKSNKRGVLMSNISYTDCSTSNRSSGTGSFISSISTLGNLDMNYISFDNCNSYNSGSGFICSINTNGQYFYANILSFKNCKSNVAYSFMSNIITGTFNTSAINFSNCSAGMASFMSEFYAYGWEQGGFLNFDNCKAGNFSFLGSGIAPYAAVTPAFNFTYCEAGETSFVKFFSSAVNAYFNFCKADQFSYGASYYNPPVGVNETTITGGAKHCQSGFASFGSDVPGTMGGPGYFSFNETMGSLSAIMAMGTYNL